MLKVIAIQLTDRYAEGSGLSEDDSNFFGAFSIFMNNKWSNVILTALIAESITLLPRNYHL